MGGSPGGHRNPHDGGADPRSGLRAPPKYESRYSPNIDHEADEGESRFRLIGTGGDHGLAREVVCSLPRSIGCRLCPGEKDCPYIVDRSFARVVVHKREPEPLVERELVDVSSGSANDRSWRTPLHQRFLAAIGWAIPPLLIAWTVLILRPDWHELAIPAALMLLTFLCTIVGVPVVRWKWRDHGGTREEGPWRPS